jgi:hypothetical protein
MVVAVILPFIIIISYTIIFAFICIKDPLPCVIVLQILTLYEDVEAVLQSDEAINIPCLSKYRENLAMYAYL